MQLDLVRAFERAVNAGDVEAAVSLVTDDVEVGGPRGSATGLEVFGVERALAAAGLSAADELPLPGAAPRPGRVDPAVG